MSSADNDPKTTVTLDELAEMHRRIEEKAAGSDWQAVESMMAERNALLPQVAEGDRPAALKAAQACTDRILRLASDARLKLAGELAKLQRGRKATDIYRANR